MQPPALEQSFRWLVRIALLSGAGAVLALLPGDGGVPRAQPSPTSLQARNAVLLEQLHQQLELTDRQLAAVEAVFARSPFLGQGNPAITRHPLSEEACREKRKGAARPAGEADFAAICGAPNMAPLYDPAKEKASDAKTCIDQFEFPDLPCAYPVVWVRAREAQELCQAVGKRLCDAHEWEGACAGSLEAPDYDFALARGVDANTAVARMRSASNRAHAASKQWSYGPAYQKGVCGTNSTKDAGCNGGDWRSCGSNTYPAGSFPECRSPLGVYDLNGNAAEHMNLPLAEGQMASRGDQLGVTEMKGSWFIFDKYQAHEDWCRWRAPFWHGSRVMDPKSHQNYHLGFRCCKSLENP